MVGSLWYNIGRCLSQSDSDLQKWQTPLVDYALVATAFLWSEQNPVFILYQTGSTNWGWYAKNVGVMVTFPVCFPRQETLN